jgi:cob(I)alamin adenosyltransferase
MLFTGYGDGGYTSVIGGPSLLKCDVRLEALGALDEAQAHLGLARALAVNPAADCLKRVQSDLHLLMADCATVHSDRANARLGQEHVVRLEAELASWEEILGGFHGLSIPGDTLLGAHLHVARTAIRRAERQAVALHQDGGIGSEVILTYLNRLSSWVYALAMMAESAEG